MRRLIAVIVVLGIAVIAMPAMVCSGAQGATWYVDTAGSDANPGTADAPFATPQKGVDMAGAGDAVIVRAGLYRGRVVFPRSGEPDRPIVLQGEEGAILDGGHVITDWEPAPEIAAGVYRKRLSFPEWPGWNGTPVNLTWNNRLVLRISSASMESGEGMARLKEPAESETWQGVEALYGTSDGVTYLRFADGRDPNQGVITVAAHWEYDEGAVVVIKGQSHIVVRGFAIRNGSVGVTLNTGASDNLVEDNAIVGGKYGVFIGYYPWAVPRDAGVEMLCHRNRIRGNEITLNFLSPITVPHPNMRWVWDQFKGFSDNDREGVALFSAGHDNEVSGNHISEHWGGIQDWGARDDWAADYPVVLRNREFCRRLRVFGNVVHDILDDGLEPSGGEVQAQWHDNLVYNCNTNIRLKFGEGGPCYIYCNRTHNPQPTPGGTCADLFHFRDNSDALVYVYQNSFASHQGNKIGANIRESTATAVCTNSWYVNNIFSNHDFGTPPYGGLPLGVHAGYNLIASVLPCSAPGEHNVVLAERRLWPADPPAFALLPDSPARGAGLDLSREWELDGVRHPALPGMAPGYFAGPAPDLGALQFGESIGTTGLPE